MTKRRITQAVVVIHGIGEQRPMDTLRSFVKAVLPQPEKGEQFFSKPDALSENLELRKLQDRNQPRTHFYEYYWAYKVKETTFWHVASWLKSLLLRRPSRVPAHLKPLWGLSWLLVLVVLGCWTWYAWRSDVGELETAPFWVATLATVAFGGLQALVLYYVGDAARYLSPHPSNIALRQAIRSDCIKLLGKLQEARESDGRRSYDRIVVVGHSLGSVIAYDAIKHLWQKVHAVYENPREHQQPKLAEVERRGEALRGSSHDAEPYTMASGNHETSGQHQPSELSATAPADAMPAVEAKVAKDERSLQDFRDAQMKLWWELQDLGNPWLVTDLVTLGSPLTHAGLLVASDPKELTERQKQRELPICPPVADEEDRNGARRYSFRVWEKYVDKNGAEHVLRAIHHAGAFAVTRWTNLYFPTSLVLLGDFISGKLQDCFGEGISDRAVSVKSWWRNHTPLAHTSYWRTSREPSEEPAIQTLIDVLDLDGDSTYEHLVTEKKALAAASEE